MLDRDTERQRKRKVKDQTDHHMYRRPRLFNMQDGWVPLAAIHARRCEPSSSRLQLSASLHMQVRSSSVQQGCPQSRHLKMRRARHRRGGSFRTGSYIWVKRRGHSKTNAGSPLHPPSRPPTPIPLIGLRRTSEEDGPLAWAVRFGNWGVVMA
jgi:hypothetical protein